VGYQGNHVALTVLHNCGKSYSQFFELLNPSKILRIFIHWAVKHYEELWRAEDRTHSVRTPEKSEG
jgi:hypothetical protein